MVDKLSYRSAAIRSRAPATLNEQDRSFEFVITTETPVRMYDWETGKVVPEVLLAKGCVMPKQVPLLDTHSRWSTADVLGSVRNKKIEPSQVVGTAYFSSVKNAEETFQKYKEGHLTDFSAGYNINDVTRVQKGEKVEIDGRAWKGPVNVVTSWTLKEASCCPIGADAKAKVRSDQPFTKDKISTKGTDEMADNEKLEALEKTIEKVAGSVATLAESVRVIADREKQFTATEEELDKMRRESVSRPALVKQKEKERIQAINLMTEQLTTSTGIDFEDLRVEMIENETSEADAYKRCIDRVATARPEDIKSGVRVSILKEDREKSRDAAVDGLMIRAGVAVDKVRDNETEYQTMSMLELAKTRLAIAGVSIRGMDQMKIFERAMTASDFSNILADVANKALLEGFEAAEETYDVWADTSGRVNDFKTHVFARASEAPSLVEVNPDGGEYKYGAVSDAKESVAVVDYGIIVPFTRKAMVNDDLGALADIREKLGAAARRKYGDLVYAVLTVNAAMGDGTALFASGHSNFVDNGSGAIPSVATLNAGAAAMATQKDIGGLQNLNIRPQYILSPWALKGTVDNVLTTTSPVAPGSAASPVVNPWSYLTPVYDARLDADDAAAWYLAARKGMTVKLFTLNGNMVPVLETREGWTVDGIEFKSRITAAAKAMDWRGLYFNDGN
jgi:hypothetical protein